MIPAANAAHGSMQRLLRVLMRLFAFAVIVLTPVAACEQYDTWWFRRFVPTKIDVDAIILSRRNIGAHGDCGAVVFRLSQPTTDAIEREGLAFFDGDGAWRPRGLREPRHYTYWRETPFPKEPEPRIEVPWEGLRCTRRHRTDFDPLIDQAYSAAHKRGSYFTTRGRDMLLVSPEYRIVVLPFWIW